MKQGQQGFTLAEMAIVVGIMGVVLLGALPTLAVIRTSQQRVTTDQALNGLMRATAAYVHTYGCLPCPTPADASGNSFGRVRGDTTSNPPACGTCAKPEGIVPFASLGITPQQARDGWGRWITMRVDPALAANPDKVIPPTAACTQPDIDAEVCPVNSKDKNQKGFCHPNFANSPTSVKVRQTGNNTPQPAAVILLSHGKNGRGAFYAAALSNIGFNGKRQVFPSNIPACTPTNASERCNADPNANTLQFVLTDAIENQSEPYDDVMAFASRDALIAMPGGATCHAAEAP